MYKPETLFLKLKMTLQKNLFLNLKKSDATACRFSMIYYNKDPEACVHALCGPLFQYDQCTAPLGTRLLGSSWWGFGDTKRP